MVDYLQEYNYKSEGECEYDEARRGRQRRACRQRREVGYIHRGSSTSQWTDRSMSIFIWTTDKRETICQVPFLLPVKSGEIRVTFDERVGENTPFPEEPEESFEENCKRFRSDFL
jgi:hypothetical protein